MYFLLNPTGTSITLSLLDRRGKALAQDTWEIQRDLHETLLPKIEAFFSAAAVLPEDVDEIVTCVGPGSYTSLRILLSVVNTFGYVLNIPLYGVSLFELELFELLECQMLNVKCQMRKVKNKNLKLRKGQKRDFCVVLKSKYAEIECVYSVVTKENGVIAVEQLKENKSGVDDMGKEQGMKLCDTVFAEGHIMAPEEGFFERKQRERASVVICMEAFVQKVLVEKNIVWKTLEPQEMLLPIYYAPPVVTTRKKRV